MVRWGLEWDNYNFKGGTNSVGMSISGIELFK